MSNLRAIGYDPIGWTIGGIDGDWTHTLPVLVSADELTRERTAAGTRWVERWWQQNEIARQAVQFIKVLMVHVFVFGQQTAHQNGQHHTMGAGSTLQTVPSSATGPDQVTVAVEAPSLCGEEVRDKGTLA